MSDSRYREVRFDMYCKTCKYEKTPETYDPCNECLEEGMNVDSEKPVRWTAKDED